MFPALQRIMRRAVALMKEEVQILLEDGVVAEVDMVDVVVFRMIREVAIDNAAMMKIQMQG